MMKTFSILFASIMTLSIVSAIQFMAPPAMHPVERLVFELAACSTIWGTWGTVALLYPQHLIGSGR